MKQEEKKEILTNGQKLEGFEDTKAEKPETGKETDKKGLDAYTFVTAGAAVAGGAVMGSATADLSEDDIIVTPGEALAEADVTPIHRLDTPVVEPEVVTPSEGQETQPDDNSEEFDENSSKEDETTSEENSEGNDATDESQDTTTEEIQDSPIEEIPIVEVDESEGIDMATTDPVEMSPEENEDIHVDDVSEVIVTPDTPIEEIGTTEIGEVDSQIELAYQEINMIDTDESESKIFSVKDRTIMQDGEEEVPAVNIVDADGVEFILADKDGDGLYESVYDSEGELVAHAKGGITDSDIDSAIDDYLYEDDVLVDDDQSTGDALVYDEDDAVVNDIENLDIDDTEIA